jgi:hypothetical protein
MTGNEPTQATNKFKPRRGEPPVWANVRLNFLCLMLSSSYPGRLGLLMDFADSPTDQRRA